MAPFQDRSKEPEPTRSNADVILEQYRAVAGVLAEIFRLFPDTSWHRDGVGNCTYDGTQDDSIPTDVPDWKERRHARRAEAHPENWPAHDRPADAEPACWYHEPHKGCSLGDLMSPICLGTSFNVPNLPKSYGRLGDVPIFLAQILDGHFAVHITGPDRGWGTGEPKPETAAANWPKIREWLAIADEVLNDCRAAYTAQTGRIPLDTIDPNG